MARKEVIVFFCGCHNVAIQLAFIKKNIGFFFSRSKKCICPEKNSNKIRLMILSWFYFCLCTLEFCSLRILRIQDVLFLNILTPQVTFLMQHNQKRLTVKGTYHFGKRLHF